MQLTPDFSIFFQVAIFIVVWLGLKRLAFDPIQQVLAERDRRTTQAQHAAEEMIAMAHADRARYEQALHERRVEMARETEVERHVAIEQANRDIAAARGVISQDLAARRATVQDQIDRARRALAAEADAIANEMLDRVVRGGAR